MTTTLDAQRGWVWTDVALKAVLVVLLAFSVTHIEWEQFADKAMTARAVLYPLLVALPALVWLLRGHRRRSGRYPAAAAALWTVPFVVDVGGNALNLYDTVGHFDDACHLLNWAMLSGAVGVLLLHGSTLSPGLLLALCTGFGATTAILWEIGEYGAFILDTPEQLTAYRDTLGDLTLGLTGSLLAGLACAAVRHRRGTGPTMGPVRGRFP